jgi:hypothetical protein
LATEGDQKLAMKFFEHCSKKFKQQQIFFSIVGLMAIVNRTINVCLFKHIQMDGCNFGASCWF